MKSISVHELKEALQSGATVFDVREKMEFALGHIEGVLNAPLSGLNLTSVPQNAILMCASGGRSASAVQALAAHGIHASNVEGGIVAWVEAGFPILR